MTHAAPHNRGPDEMQISPHMYDEVVMHENSKRDHGLQRCEGSAELPSNRIDGMQ